MVLPSEVRLSRGAEDAQTSVELRLRLYYWMAGMMSIAKTGLSPVYREDRGVKGTT